MKRHGNLFEKIVSEENIELAFEKARKGKNWQDDVKEVVKDKEKKLAALRQSLIDGTFKTSKYRVKTIFEPKKKGNIYSAILPGPYSPACSDECYSANTGRNVYQRQLCLQKRKRTACRQ